MEWEIILHENKRYIEVITKGHADRDGSLEMAKVITENMRKHKYKKALIDHRKITSVSGRAAEIYYRPRIFKIIGVILGIKIAEIVKKEHVEHFRFLETVCNNHGFKFSIFHEREEAMEWLFD